MIYLLSYGPGLEPYIKNFSSMMGLEPLLFIFSEKKVISWMYQRI